MQNLLFVAAGGAAGALLRHAMTRGAVALTGDSTGAAQLGATLGANALGCLLAGAVAWATLERFETPEHVRLGLLVGFLGALTTFSTFGVQTLELAQRGAWAGALANVALNNAVSLGCVWLGYAAARRALGGG